MRTFMYQDFGISPHIPCFVIEASLRCASQVSFESAFISQYLITVQNIYFLLETHATSISVRSTCLNIHGAHGPGPFVVRMCVSFKDCSLPKFGTAQNVDL